ncbi:hypothetical protein LguiB_002345 [Lonicera macranthoides]
MEFEREEDEEVVAPVSPSGLYLTSSFLSLTILGVLELEGPIIDYSKILSLLKDVFLPINPRFSSIMVERKKGVKKWKRVEVKFNDHIIVPVFPQGMSLDFYDEHLNQYLSKIAMDPLPQSQPLWQIHLIKYPTNNSHGNIIFKIHHALGDGYSIIGVLLSCLQRVDNPSLPLTFPSRQSNSNSGGSGGDRSINHVPRVILGFFNTMLDFGWSFLKSSVIEDDTSPIRSGGNTGVEFRPVTITTMSFSLDRIKQVKAKLGVTINDVISGAILFGIRKYMEEESYESRNAKSTALVLLNTRSLGGYQSVSEMIKPNAKMPWGNHFAFLHLPIPKLLNCPHKNSSNPIDFVFNVHKMVKKKRNSAAVHLTGRLLEVLRKFRGPEASAKYIHSTIKNSSMGISNLIGPVEQMAMANHPVQGLYFCVTGPPQSLTTSVISYMEKMWICLGMEKGFIDSYKLKACIQNAFDILFKSTA